MFRTLSLSRSIPDLDTTASMEEMERVREKQKLLNMSMDYGSYSPLTLTSTHPSRYSNTDLSMYDDPWGIQRHVIKQEQQLTYKQQHEEMNDMSMPSSNPFLIKNNSIPINPFHTDVAPSAMLFPYDTTTTTIQQQQHEQQQQQSQTSLFDDMISPANQSFMSDDSDEDDNNDIHTQTYKRQRGIDNNTIYIKQEQQEDQDILLPVLDVYDQTQQQHTQPQQQPFLCSQPSQHGFIDYTAMATANTNIDISSLYSTTQDIPFTLESTTTPFTITPLSISTRRSFIDSIESNDSQNNKRKRKSSTSTTTTTKQRKSQLIGTHAIENTGAPVKMAKYLHVDGLTTQVWLEHAVYEEAGICTDIRMIMYSGAFNGVVVHAGDVGERIVCNRRSNISREFGQYASPNEKILIRIPSEHRPLGQTGNVLTGYGLIRFLQSKKMRKSENQAYRKWLLNHVYHILHTRPFTFPDGHPIATRTTPITPFTEADFSH